MDSGMSVGLQEELIADLTSELENEPAFNSNLLTSKVVSAIREVKRIRRYPSFYSEEQINKDLYNYYSDIRNIVIYDYNKVGADGEQSHSENGVNRTYTDRNKLFVGILPIASF